MKVKEQKTKKITSGEQLRKLRFIEQVNRGLEDSKANRVYTMEEVKEKLSKWLK